MKLTKKINAKSEVKTYVIGDIKTVADENKINSANDAIESKKDENCTDDHINPSDSLEKDLNQKNGENKVVHADTTISKNTKPKEDVPNSTGVKEKIKQDTNDTDNAEQKNKDKEDGQAATAAERGGKQATNDTKEENTNKNDVIEIFQDSDDESIDINEIDEE